MALQKMVYIIMMITTQLQMLLLDSQKMAEKYRRTNGNTNKRNRKSMKKNSEQDNSISEMQEELKNLRNISNMLPTISKKVKT